MNAAEAIDRLEPTRWASVSPAERLHLLEEVRGRMREFADELAAADTKMKNDLMGEPLFGDPMSLIATIVPLANTVTACIELYESIVHGHMPEPIAVRNVRDDLYEVQVFPKSSKDKLMNADRHDSLWIRGTPKQTNPMEKPPGIIAVLGAGNYSSSLEMVKAMFLENCAVVHKPHHLNGETDAVWEKIMQPLVEIGALSFCSSDQGRVLTKDPRLSKIYFTGGTQTAEAIMKATDTELVSECGGNNPCIIVPGDRPWTEKELEHQALQIATISKLNGGAVCGRIQTLVVSKHWPQRQQFMRALEKAIEEDTPAAGTYYPGSAEVAKRFKDAYPHAKVLKPEGGKFRNGDFVVIEDAEEDGFATQNEAFCQIMNEVALDVPAEAEAFLPAAVEFCNTKLLGTLGSSILIDEDTKAAHAEALDAAVADMEYGGIAVNTMPPFIFLSPYLTWGGNEEGKAFVSGSGNFGNLLCFENVEKSVIHDSFMSAGHMLNVNKHAFDSLAKNMARFSMNPSWMNMTRLIGAAVAGGLRHKDF